MTELQELIKFRKLLRFLVRERLKEIRADKYDSKEVDK